MIFDIVHNPSVLEGVSLSKGGSIASLWVQEPSFSNAGGTVTFEGVTFNPGFTGPAGKMLTLNFRIKSAGDASLRFSSAAILANDGKGTNILSTARGADFSFGASEILEKPAGEELPPTTSQAPSPPHIVSSTHPDFAKWYATTNAAFSWDASPDITGTRLLVSKFPTDTPTVTYASAINSKIISNLNDGVWYFHVSLRNSFGWGKPAHYRFQIDTEKPSSLEIEELPREDLTDPRARFTLSANDTTSGVDHYEISFDEKSSQNWTTDTYETPPVRPGEHVLKVKVFDKAGNFLEDVHTFQVNSLEVPIIKQYPREVQRGEAITIEGSTKYPHTPVILWFVREGEDPKSSLVETDEQGNFIFTNKDGLREGVHMFWAEVTDARGAISNPSQKFQISVYRISFAEIIKWFTTMLSIFIPFLALLVLLGIVLRYGLPRLFFGKKRKKEAREANDVLHKVFDFLRDDIRKQIKMLENARTHRELTEEEEIVIKRLKNNLDKAERVLQQEIKDVKKGGR